MKKLISLLLALTLLLGLTGCHGKIVERTQEDTTRDPSEIYEIPDSFDTSRNFEITFSDNVPALVVGASTEVLKSDFPSVEVVVR